eukprot:gene6764-8389_t
MSSVTQNDWTSEVPEEKVTEVIVKNEKGEEVKVTKRFHEYQVVVKRNKRVDERKKWAKFSGVDDSNCLLNTSYGDEQFLKLSRNIESSEEIKDIVQCRNCKKNHFTAKCPYKDALELSQKQTKSDREEKGGKDMQGGKYVVPSQRAGYQQISHDVPGLMVSNLSENATEQDLRDLFGQFGNVSKVNIPKTMAGKPKGYAYVTFNNLRDAEEAIKHLNGHRYDYLVLGVEFSRRRPINQ